jgi:hypothetical protein
MFSEVVEHTVEKLAREMVHGIFHIGLDAVKRYVLFWCMANYLQEQQMSERMSIEQYASSTFSLTTEERNKLTKDGVEKADRLWKAYYERKLDHYNSINLEKKVALLLRQKQETQLRLIKKAKNENLEGNAKRFQGLSLFPYQLEEFAVLDGIKEGQAAQEIGRTYKRIVSNKGYLQKMTFKEYREFVALLKDEVDQSQDPYKNVRYYKLEKRLGFEAVKAVLKAIKDCREQNKWPVEIVVRDLTYVLRLPFLSERQQYAEVYPELNWEERNRWGMELLGILTFTEACILAAKQTLDESKGSILQPTDWECFETLYLPESYENDYLQRKDFAAEDFTLLMTVLDEQNTQAFEQFRNHIQDRS